MREPDGKEDGEHSRDSYSTRTPDEFLSASRLPFLASVRHERGGTSLLAPERPRNSINTAFYMVRSMQFAESS